MSISIMAKNLLCFFLVVAPIISTGCGKSAPEIASQPTSSQQKSPATASPALQKPTEIQTAASPESTQPSNPAPGPAEVQQAVTRVYKNAVVIDNRRDPDFWVGDFNGDGSQDLAVIVKPAEGMLAKINSDIANWIVEDPQQVFIPAPHQAITVMPRKAPPVRVGPSDVLLAVIHGYGPEGWRNAQAMQTFLLKNAVGSKLEVRPKKQMLLAGGGKERFPVIRGDVIEGMFAQAPGFIYWGNGNYILYREP